MCEFCHKHGEGKKWYLQAKNYSDDLLSDLKRRKFFSEFTSSSSEDIAKAFEELDKMPRKKSLIRNIFMSHSVNKMIDPTHCYGCGVCRSSCEYGAIELRERKDVPAAADLWQ